MWFVDEALFVALEDLGREARIRSEAYGVERSTASNLEMWDRLAAGDRR